MSTPERRKTVAVDVGGVKVGGKRPIVVQSMTNTDTADVAGTVAQVIALPRRERAGARDREQRGGRGAVPEIVKQVTVPIIGDFHYNGHLLLAKYPECARALAKYRINPGNVGGKRRDDNFRTIVEIAVENGKPVRIGVNWGSLDQDLLTRDDGRERRAARAARRARRLHRSNAGERARSAELAEEVGLAHDRIIISRQGLAACRIWSRSIARSPRAATTRCTSGSPRRAWARRASSRAPPALSILLQEGIGDTIRVSLTPKPNGDRTEEVQVAQQILQSLGLRSFTPQVTACPGCGRTTSTFFQQMAEDIQTYLREQMPVWQAQLPGRGGDEGGGDGLRRERPRRIEARQHRHLAARNVRGAEGAGVRRRRSSSSRSRATTSSPSSSTILEDYVEKRYAGSRT